MNHPIQSSKQPSTRNSRFIWRATLIIACIAAIAGCMPSKQTGTTYSRDEVRAVQNVKLGRVVDVTVVQIEGTRSGAGEVVGGALGGVAGKSTGSGSKGDLAAIAAGVAGAVIGSKIEEASTKAEGREYTIRLDDGEVISVVQALDKKAEAIVAGDSVKLLSQGGTFRVTKLKVAL